MSVSSINLEWEHLLRGNKQNKYPGGGGGGTGLCQFQV